MAACSFLHIQADLAVYTWSTLSLGCLKVHKTSLNYLGYWVHSSSEETKGQYYNQAYKVYYSSKNDLTSVCWALAPKYKLSIDKQQALISLADHGSPGCLRAICDGNLAPSRILNYTRRAAAKRNYA